MILLVNVACLFRFFSKVMIGTGRVSSSKRRGHPIHLLVAALLLVPAGASATSLLLERTFEVPGATEIDDSATTLRQGSCWA